VGAGGEVEPTNNARLRFNARRESAISRAVSECAASIRHRAAANSIRMIPSVGDTRLGISMSFRVRSVEEVKREQAACAVLCSGRIVVP
jgi:hypothetical protein